MAVNPDKQWFVYLLECKNGRIYTGITSDLHARFRRHASGRGAMFTRRNPPSHMIAVKQCDNRSVASKLEWVIKKLSAKKKRLLAEQWPMIKNLPGR